MSALTITNFSPVNETGDVGSNFVIKFSENIQPGSAYITLNISDGKTVSTYSQATIYIQTSGNTLTINPPEDLKYSTSYTVELEVGSIKDLNGNEYTGTSYYNFSTKSLTPGQSIISLGSAGKLIYPVQVDGGHWYYYLDKNGNGKADDGADDYNTSDVGLIFKEGLDGSINPNFRSYGSIDSTYHYATINGVKISLPSLNGTLAPPQPTGWTIGIFPYGTSVGSPTATNGSDGTLTPANGSNQVNKTFDGLLSVWDAYNGQSTSQYLNGTPPGWASMRWSAAGSLTYNGNGNGSYYHLGLAAGVITPDVKTNSIGSLVVELVDVFQPHLVTPASSIIFSSIRSNITVQCNEDIQRGSGEIILKALAGTTIAVYSKTSSNVTISSDTITIDPTADLSYGTSYKVVFGDDSVRDLSGNSIAGTASYEFSTASAPQTAKFWNNLSIVTSDAGASTAIDLSDAIGILKMIVGLAVNGSSIPLSPYQSIAADFNQNGKVGLDDAIDVLKMIVGLSAPAPTWKYFDISKIPSIMNAIESLSPLNWIGDAAIADITSANSAMNVIGVLTGDVNGSWI